MADHSAYGANWALSLESCFRAAVAGRQRGERRLLASEIITLLEGLGFCRKRIEGRVVILWGPDNKEFAVPLDETVGSEFLAQVLEALYKGQKEEVEEALLRGRASMLDKRIQLALDQLKERERALSASESLNRSSQAPQRNEVDFSIPAFLRRQAN